MEAEAPYITAGWIVNAVVVPVFPSLISQKSHQKMPVLLTNWVLSRMRSLAYWKPPLKANMLQVT